MAEDETERKRNSSRSENNDITNERKRKLKMTSRYWTRLRDFAATTTAHGMGQIAQSSLLIERLLWCVLVCCATGYVLYQIVLIIQEYRLYPIAVISSVKSRPSLQFPRVTICNYNPLKLTAIRSSPFAELFKVRLALIYAFFSSLKPENFVWPRCYIFLSEFKAHLFLSSAHKLLKVSRLSHGRLSFTDGVSNFVCTLYKA